MPFRLLDEETRAARERSPRLLRAAIVRLVIEGADEWRKDDRDFMVALVPIAAGVALIGTPCAIRVAQMDVYEPGGLTATSRLLAAVLLPALLLLTVALLLVTGV